MDREEPGGLQSVVAKSQMWERTYTQGKGKTDVREGGGRVCVVC